MGVERRASRRVPSGVRAEEPTGQLPGVGQFAAVVVEDLRDGSPTRPAGEDALLIGGRSGGPIPELLQDVKGCEVGGELGCCSGWGEVSLTNRPERYAGRCWRTQVSIAVGVGSSPIWRSTSGAWL